MAFSLTLYPLLALALGLKHAYDADHLVAVSNFLTRSRGISDTSRMTLSWAMGHMLTAAAITVAAFSLATQTESITALLSNFELGVAIMLIVIGTIGILLEVPIVHNHTHHHSGGKIHSHQHRHRFGGLGGFARRTHLHHPLFGVGIIHGLASNDELLILFVAGLGVGSLELLIGGVAIFTVGVVLGMLLFGIAVSSLYKSRARRVQVVINLAVGSLSIIYGWMIIAGLGNFNPFNLLSFL